MPTIEQLPPATCILPSDEIPISQGGSVHAVSVGMLLSTTQSVITIGSASLLGRTSLGSGSPEQIDIGIGMSLSGGTVVANGADHATFPSAASLSIGSDLVISNQGSQMLMPTEFLRGLFSAGQNVAIDSNGVISTTAGSALSQTTTLGSAVEALQVVSSVSAQDIVPIGHAGADYAITYANFLNGLTIDEAPPARPATDADTIWVAQATNVMGSQNFAAIWSWITAKLPTYKLPVIEVTTSINLDATVHNGRILVCSQPITLTPLSNNMGSGFQCQVINLSSGTVTLGAGFLTSSGSSMLGPNQSTVIQCISYSGGTIVYAALSQGAVAAPGQVINLAASSIAATSLNVSWQQPSSGGAPSSYTIQYRQAGATSWTSSLLISQAQTSCQITGLQANTGYNIEVMAANAAGFGPASSILTVSTSQTTQAPNQVTGLTATPNSATDISLSWSGQTGGNAATTYTVQYGLAGASAWTSVLPGISSTTYDVAGLQPATAYNFSIFGVNPSGAGPTSVVVSATTAAAGSTASVPGQVIGLTASGITTTMLTLAWQQSSAGGTPSSYTVQYRTTGSTGWTSIQTAASATSYQLTGLQPITSYDFQIRASNSSGSGPASAMLTASTTQIAAPNQVSALVATASSSSTVLLSWSSQTGTNAPLSYSVQYRTTGATAWASAGSATATTSYQVVGLQPATSYDFTVFGVNAGGTGPTSLVVSATTTSVGAAVSSIVWNLAPSGSYPHASGSIGLNVHVTPSSAAVQFGFSTSSTMPPSTWTVAAHVNTDLWGAYLSIPSTVGTWYAWAEGTDGSSPVVFPTPFVTQ